VDLILRGGKFDQQKRHAETGEAPEYLITAEKAVLAMGDYVKKLSLRSGLHRLEE